MNSKLKILVIVLVSVLLISQYKTISRRFSNNVQKTLNYKNKEQQTNTSIKTILYWTSMFGQKDHYLGLGQKIFENCSHTNCYATYDRDYLPVERFDALIFHARDYKPSAHGKPSKRNPKQVYIFENLESPENTPHTISDQNGFYNWTMTYRLDSDIVRPYGTFRENKTVYQAPSFEEIRKRSKKIAWFVSHCGTASKREKLVERIGEVLPVDIYGHCGQFSCPRSKERDCYDMMEKKYNFYLSFENSVCQDYVTEKLFNVLKKDVVPVVYGGADYGVMAPPRSVINVRDFKSVQNLTDYIQYVDANPEEYVKYFEWKKNYVVETSRKAVVCDLCRKLNEAPKQKVYDNIFTWWFGDHRNKCFYDTIGYLING